MLESTEVSAYRKVKSKAKNKKAEFNLPVQHT